MQEAAVSVHDSVAGILSEVISELLILSVLHADGFWYAQIDSATRSQTSGTFRTFDGNTLPW